MGLSQSKFLLYITLTLMSFFIFFSVHMSSDEWLMIGIFSYFSFNINF